MNHDNLKEVREINLKVLEDLYMKSSKKKHVQAKQIQFPIFGGNNKKSSQKNFHVKKQFAPYTIFRNPHSPGNGLLN